jgi:hypothetical protein
MVDHSIFRTMKGAVGMLHVSGRDAPEIFTQLKGLPMVNAAH